jgi:hypothetical protein
LKLRVVKATDTAAIEAVAAVEKTVDSAREAVACPVIARYFKPDKFSIGKVKYRC